jgi:molybdenum cofactor cytidylyltransferase
MTQDTELPVVAPPFAESEGTGRVVGVVLAAGTSTRFDGGNKLLAEWDGDPLVRHATATLCQASLDTVVVVVGHEADAVRAAVAALDVTVVHNEDYESGQASSVARAVAFAREGDAEAVLFALGDMPSVRPDTVDPLLDAYRTGVGDAIAAAHEGSRGNPVLFDAVHFDTLAALQGDVGGREILLDGDGSVLVETGDPGVLADVNHPDDLESLPRR